MFRLPVSNRSEKEAHALVIFSTVANAQSTKQCIICKNGISSPSFMPRADIGDTSTCKQIVEGAAMFDTDSDMCQALMSGELEDACCPSKKMHILC